MADLGLRNKVAMVTGGARGISKAIAEKLAEEGAKLVITDINEKQAQLSAAEIEKKYTVEVMAQKHDVSSEESTKEIIKAAVSRFSRIDILINNAGITRDSRMMIMSLEDWNMVLRVNLTGAFICTKLVSKQMLKQNYGSIVNIVSVVGIIGNIGQANYSSSKAGLIGLTKTAAREVASRGITVNAVAPGFIRSDMTEVLSETVTKKLLDEVPMNSYGTPEDVANAVLFLVSNRARYITGHILNVDGGMAM